MSEYVSEAFFGVFIVALETGICLISLSAVALEIILALKRK